MYKFKNILNKEEYTKFDEKKMEYRYLNIYKRSLLYGPNMYRNFDRDLFNDIEEKEYEVKLEYLELLKNIKNKIFDKMFLKKKDKHKQKFIKNKCVLPEDLLGLVYDFYNESRYTIAIKFREDTYMISSKYLLSNNLFLIKNIFLNNHIESIYKINTDKFNNSLFKIVSIDFFEAYSQPLYYGENEKFYDISKIVHNNDFYAPIIVIKLFYFKRKKIHAKNFYISNYNILYIIKDFVINKKISRYEFFYINKITNFRNYKNYIPIDIDEMQKYYFLSEIYDYLIKLFKNNIVKFQK